MTEPQVPVVGDRVEARVVGTVTEVHEGRYPGLRIDLDDGTVLGHDDGRVTAFRQPDEVRPAAAAAPDEHATDAGLTGGLDPTLDGLYRAEEAIEALWVGPGRPPIVDELDVNATADRLATLLSLLEHLDPIVSQLAEQSLAANGLHSPTLPDLAPNAVHTRLTLFAEQLLEAAANATIAHTYLTALSDDNRTDTSTAAPGDA